ncbi:hypothetical protein FYK55_09100 [Roseiconus nitratireducens]|uniref:Glycosyltransferase RgtA/B/C/D-like domain-containing protein n=1 Tax=Roseiconus nitratireducens TaxID=2605748 RepID=A0A5M6DA85_9BACT|nr:hypothetical protein [Roseiconus nitratireducens]KAA5544477.1 hypothetical protein FYK55_09100 [Roseiconus nitratireducens]
MHSAWAVDDGLAQVAARARVGNQTAPYFQALWGWRRLVGSGEWGLRFSSVLASSCAAALLVVGVAKQTGRLAGGVIAGGLFAMNSNAVFFGCELRPYAAVMLCSVLATCAAMTGLENVPSDPATESGHLGPQAARPRWRMGLTLAICASALLHPTSLGVLGWWIPVCLIIDWKRHGRRLNLWDGVAIVALLVTAALLWNSSLRDSWSHRDQWRAFGHVTDSRAFLNAWRWGALVGVPAVCGVSVWLATARKSNATAWRAFWLGALPAIIATLGTATFFWLSYSGWVPLWHRRYYVAALPMLAWSAGAIAAPSWSTGAFAAPSWRAGAFAAPSWSEALTDAGAKWRFWTGIIAVVVVLGFQGHIQGTWAMLGTGRLPRQLRGEDWRQAAAFVNRHRTAGQPVWLDSGLIETGFFAEPYDSELEERAPWNYLAFPLRGPYAVEDVAVLSVFADESWIRRRLEALPAGRADVWLISRSGPRSVQAFVRRVGSQRQVTHTESLAGRISVHRLQFAADSSARGI